MCEEINKIDTVIVCYASECVLNLINWANKTWVPSVGLPLHFGNKLGQRNFNWVVISEMECRIYHNRDL